MVADVFAGDERAGQERRDEGFGGSRRAADDDLDAVLLEKLLGARASKSLPPDLLERAMTDVNGVAHPAE